MALTQEVIQQMKKLAAFDHNEIDEMLQALAREDAEKWRNAVNLIILTLWTEHSFTRKYTQRVGGAVSDIRKFLSTVAAQTGGAEVAQEAAAAPPSMQATGVPPVSEETLIGADGQPITDPAQIEAERILSGATGTPLQTAGPPPGRQQPGRRPRGRAQAAPANEPIIGADGQPITDPEQIKAELIMRQTLGE